MQTLDELQTLTALADKVEHLCARCEAQAREIRRLRTENQLLRDKNDKARDHIRTIMDTLPNNSIADIK